MIDLAARLKGLKREHIPSDLERVLSMPLVSSTGDEEAARRWTEELSITGEFALRPIQGKALDVVQKWKGGFASVGVGHGKTLISLLAGMAAGRARIVVLVPPSLKKQMEAELEFWSHHFKIDHPPTIVSYGIISTRPTILEDLKPDFVVADEVHYLKNGTVRTRRFLAYFRRNPRCGFLGLSGTITTRSLLDYSHILEVALRDRAPIPLNRHELARWAATIDADGEPTQADLMRLGLLVKWAFPGRLQVSTKESIRRAFRERLTTTPGVITTKTSSCDASLYLKAYTPKHSAAVKKALKRLQNEWVDPDGKELADASTKSRIFKNLSLGFYYRWIWPNGEPDEIWLEARRRLDRMVGKVVRYHPRPGRDSAALVLDWVKAGGGRPELREAYEAWEAVKHRPGPENETVWICREKIEFIRDWVFEQKEDVIVWFTSKAIGAALEAAGMVVHGRGTAAPTGGTCAASIAVHGKGRNLQMYHNCFVVEPPANGGTWEQLLGRTHRAGQPQHEVWWHFFNYGDALRRSKSHAEYIESTQGTVQKLNCATYLTTG